MASWVRKNCKRCGADILIARRASGRHQDRRCVEGPGVELDGRTHLCRGIPDLRFSEPAPDSPVAPHVKTR